MNMSVNYEELSTASNEVSNQSTEYMLAVRKLYDTVENLSEHWKGSDNEQYKATLAGHRSNLEALGTVIRNYGSFLGTTASELRKLQEEVASGASRLG